MENLARCSTLTYMTMYGSWPTRPSRKMNPMRARSWKEVGTNVTSTYSLLRVGRWVTPPLVWSHVLRLTMMSLGLRPRQELRQVHHCVIMYALVPSTFCYVFRCTSCQFYTSIVETKLAGSKLGWWRSYSLHKVYVLKRVSKLTSL